MPSLFDCHGDMGASIDGPDGLFGHDSRYLPWFEILIDGMEPLLLSSSVRGDNLTLTAECRGSRGSRPKVERASIGILTEAEGLEIVGRAGLEVCPTIEAIDEVGDDGVETRLVGLVKIVTQAFRPWSHKFEFSAGRNRRARRRIRVLLSGVVS
jgi:hypothetical protein